MTQHTTRAERMAQPRAADAIKALAEASGGCIRPVQLRRTDLDTGQVEQVIVPCGATLATLCPACAERAKSLRAAQCREGWHLEDEPIPPPAPPDDWQAWLLEQRAELQQLRDRMHAAGDETAGLDELIGEVDAELARSGIRGNPDPGASKKARHRSTRRRQDAPALPRRKISPRTTGKVYTAPEARRSGPSMFLTLTCDSYGKVLEDGTPADPASYDYRRAARDAIHFAALVDRFIQNLRRFLGYDVQYFAAVEPQKRLAPHVHLAIRGTVSRADLRQVLAATYHQVWWPSTDVVRFDGDQLPVWHEAVRELPRPGHRGSPADLGPGPRRHRPARRAVARGPVRAEVRRPGRAGRVEGLRPVHPVPDQVPDQEHRRLPPPPTPPPSSTTPTGSPTPCATSPAPRRARTGCATASSPRTRAKACGPARARARPTAPSTWATPGAGSWSPASGRARPWPITAATARPGCCPCSACPTPTTITGTGGRRSPRPTVIT